jgi:hypothetical protein
VFAIELNELTPRQVPAESPTLTQPSMTGAYKLTAGKSLNRSMKPPSIALRPIKQEQPQTQQGSMDDFPYETDLVDSMSMVTTPYAITALRSRRRPSEAFQQISKAADDDSPVEVGDDDDNIQDPATMIRKAAKGLESPGFLKSVSKQLSPVAKIVTSIPSPIKMAREMLSPHLYSPIQQSSSINDIRSLDEKRPSVTKIDIDPQEVKTEQTYEVSSRIVETDDGKVCVLILDADTSSLFKSIS